MRFETAPSVPSWYAKCIGVYVVFDLLKLEYRRNQASNDAQMIHKFSERRSCGRPVSSSSALMNKNWTLLRVCSTCNLNKIGF